ncbi:ABC transporter substrate-binding protein [Eubacteriales bacterium OttesenSCG-928-N13]|nr:ABC transporter substrate-binding protein [Eubacteriales bacterium OttesenSCG-928-N13]
MKKRLIMLLTLILALSLCVAPCALAADSLNIAYQYGMSYAPLLIMKEQGLIEKHYGQEVEINWQVLNSGAAINEGMTAGSIDIGAMGVGPAVTGVMVGIPYKIFSALSSQPHGIMTNVETVTALKDITPDMQIAMVNIGSIQHILLAMACEKELGDAHALDQNILAMSHPDGMTALVSGAVECQLTTSPYLFREAEFDNLHKISSIEDVWPNGNTFIVGMASNRLHDENPDLYNAVVEAMKEATLFLTENRKAAAELLCENENVTAETMLTWLSDPACGYDVQLKGVMTMATFMADNGFIPKGPSELSELAYDNVTGD